jgi:hypothetical protein
MVLVSHSLMYQASAASGSTITAGAGMTLAGSTLGIDPTAVVHVAGISADGGITLDGLLNIVGSGDTHIRIPNGGYISNSQSSNNPTIRFATNEVQLNAKSSGSVPRLGVNLTNVYVSNAPFVTGSGISMNTDGITFPDGTYQASAASGSTITAGAGMTLAGSTLGIDPTAVVHVAGISSDGGITAGNISINNVTNEITMPTGGRIKSPGSHNIYFPTTGIQIQAAGSSNNSFEVVTGRAIVNSSLLLHIKGSGISMDQGGITFADGTYQDTAATGSTITAGAGMTLAGSTLGIDSTAVVHVAGISSDGGATFDGNIYANRFYGSNNINTGMVLDAGFRDLYLKSNDVTCMHMWYSAVIAEQPFTANQSINAVGLLTASSGITLGNGITFADGTYQDTAASGSTITAGAGMTLAGSTLGIRSNRH